MRSNNSADQQSKICYLESRHLNAGNRRCFIALGISIPVSVEGLGREAVRLLQ